MKLYRILILTAAILLGFSGCKKEKLQTIDYFPNIESAPDIQIDNVKSLYFSNSKIKIKITAPQSAYYFKNRRNPHMEFPKGLIAVFYDDNMKPISTIKADNAIYYQRNKLWKIAGNVEVVNQSGAKLRTQELYYDEDKERLFSIKFVEVQDTSGSIIRGKGGFVSNLQFTNYQFKNVDGIIVTYQNITPNE